MAYWVVIGGHGALPCRATEESLGRFLGESFDSLDRGRYGLHIERRSRENTETFLSNFSGRYMTKEEKLREFRGF